MSEGYMFPLQMLLDFKKCSQVDIGWHEMKCQSDRGLQKKRGMGAGDAERIDIHFAWALRNNHSFHNE